MREQFRPILMVVNVVAVVAVLVVLVLFLRSRPAARAPEEAAAPTRGQVHQLILDDVRLANGVPLQLTFSVQWEIASVDDFADQYGDADTYAAGVLHPKAHELADAVARSYADPDAAFTTQRDAFTRGLKDAWRKSLGERNVSITDVFITDITIGEIARDRVYQTTLSKVQLADGVPLDVTLTVRWRIDDVERFLRQFSDPQMYTDQVLQPKAHELARQVANTYKDVDEVFTTRREHFVQALKRTSLEGLGEAGVVIHAVSVQDITFPKKYTDAMETVAMKERELEQIRQQGVADLERSKAEEKKAAAEGEVQIVRARAAGSVAAIEAEAEAHRRVSALAKAETEAQVKERGAQAEAKRSQLVAQTEAERMRDLADVEVEKTRKLKDVEVARLRETDALAQKRQQALAELVATNPAYATYLVNKELASKVSIAVLPVGTNTSVLGDLLKGAMTPE